jgi:hypothetical protein
MKRPGVLIFLFIILITGVYNNAYSQRGSYNQDSVLRISVGGGVAFSTINMRIEPLGQLKTGWNLRSGIRFKRRLGIAAEYTYQVNHGAEPAWENIRAYNLDVNLTYLYFNVSESNTKFYALNGVCFQQWVGEYKGPAAVNQDNLDYKVGDFKRFNWASLNAGIGFERRYDHVGLYGEFKFRFGKNSPSDPFGIVDVCGTVGAKINLVTIGKKTKPDNSFKSRQKRRTIKPKIYHWF